jgi:streptomycin 6-kinase
MTSFSLPLNLRDGMLNSPLEEHREWLAGLPEIVGELSARWSLRVGEPFQPGGSASWVAPATGAGGRECVLKVGWRHYEADHEPDALRAWDGRGAVRLYAAQVNGPNAALLLERCSPGTSLKTLPEPEQDVVIADLLLKLWPMPAGAPAFRPLQNMCEAWATQFELDFARSPGPVDPELARTAMHLMRTLPATADREALLSTDLHAENVLAAEREPWLVIDPKPYAGDPAYDVIQHLLNCQERLVADPAGVARRMAGLLDLDPGRVVDWLFARCVIESLERRPVLYPVAVTLARQVSARF